MIFASWLKCVLGYISKPLFTHTCTTACLSSHPHPSFSYLWINKAIFNQKSLQKCTPLKSPLSHNNISTPYMGFCIRHKTWCRDFNLKFEIWNISSFFFPRVIIDKSGIYVYTEACRRVFYLIVTLKRKQTLTKISSHPKYKMK